MLTPEEGVDLLTRTIIKIDGSMTAPAISRVVQALQHVPGVLLVEADAASACAIVAHDPAVKPEWLLAAVLGAGERATIVAETRTSAMPVSARALPGSRRIRYVGLAALSLVASL